LLRRVGVLLVGLSPDSKQAKQFRLGLRDAGYSEGHDVIIEWRSANGDYDRVPALVADLIQSKVDVIVQDSTVGTEITMRATSTIPIVMALVLDPVGSGLVKSLAHPGGNVTGLSMMATELYPKRMQLLKEVKPQLARVAVLWNPDHPFHIKAVEQLKAIASSLSIELSFAAVRAPDQFGPGFSDIIRAQAQALYVVEDPIFFAHQATLLSLSLASTARLPTIHELGRWPEAGGLMSYGPDLHDLFRRAAIYVARILRGANPADLPVEQPTKFELVINLKTAKVLGLEIPPTNERPYRDEGARQSWRDPAGASPEQVRPSKPPGSECCVRRRQRRTRSVHSGCVGCVIEPRNDETAGAEAVTYGRTQHVQCRYARHCRPAGVEEHITRKWIVSEPGIPLVWPLLFASAVRIGKVRSRSRWCTDMRSRTSP
jgi:putative ABC transport system substrate-binding protein